jgi:hypothetical protein
MPFLLPLPAITAQNRLAAFLPDRLPAGRACMSSIVAVC